MLERKFALCKEVASVQGIRRPPNNSHKQNRVSKGCLFNRPKGSVEVKHVSYSFLTIFLNLLEMKVAISFILQSRRFGLTSLVVNRDNLNTTFGDVPS